MVFERLLAAKKVYGIMAILALLIGCNPSPATALPVGSFEHSGTYAQDRQIIDTVLAEELVAERLAALGLSKEQINVRLDQLSDAEMHQLAQHLERIKAGGDGWVIALVVVLIIIGVVFFFLTHNVHVEPRERLAD